MCRFPFQKFNAQAAFDNHVRVHTNQRPFVCSVCDKGFKQKSHLTEHERIHSGQKPFTCAECGLGFYNRSRFEMHQVRRAAVSGLTDERVESCCFCCCPPAVA